jgi:long-chain acyl-CoA synthetase
MNKPHRLFDFFDQRLQDDPQGTMLAGKEGGKYREYSVTEVKAIVDQLSAGLISLGYSANNMTLEGRDKIAIIAKNRPEWMFLDLAVAQIGVVVVAIYTTKKNKHQEIVIKDAHVKTGFLKY